MKTPEEMLNDIAAQISEGNTLLEMIYKNSGEMNEETDCGIACLIRSLDKTRETTYGYIDELVKNKNAVLPPPKGSVLILRMMYFTQRLARRNSGSLFTFIVSHILPEKTVMTLIV